MYGLHTSPRDRAFRRDHDVRKVKILRGGRCYRLYQSYAEPGLWLVSLQEPKLKFSANCHREMAAAKAVEGWADDLMIAAFIQTRSGVLVLRREAYVTQLCKKYVVEPGPATPMAPSFNDELVEDHIDVISIYPKYPLSGTIYPYLRIQ